MIIDWKDGAVRLVCRCSVSERFKTRTEQRSVTCVRLVKRLNMTDVVLVVRAMLLRAAQLQQSNSSMTGLSTMLQKVRRSSQKEEGGGKLGYTERC